MKTFNKDFFNLNNFISFQKKFSFNPTDTQRLVGHVYNGPVNSDQY